MIDAKDLAARRSGGHVAFIWYRANLTIPAKIGDFDTAGAKAVLTVLVNMPNRVVLADAVKPGDKFQIAVFGINGPISVAPANTVWFREARIEFYR
jgi:hypothetical protein